MTQLQEIARCLLEIDAAGRAADTDAAFETVTRVIADRIGGAVSASVVVQRSPRRFRTAAGSDAQAFEADAVQFELGHGPSLAAVVDGRGGAHVDLAGDHGWGQVAALVRQRTGFEALLAFPLRVDDGALRGCLNVYAVDPSALDRRAAVLTEIVAVHAASVVTTLRSRATIGQLTLARESNRVIGVAIGVLMARRMVTAERAFDLLRTASQNTNRKLLAVATEVVDTGDLMTPGVDDRVR